MSHSFMKSLGMRHKYNNYCITGGRVLKALQLYSASYNSFMYECNDVAIIAIDVKPTSVH